MRVSVKVFIVYLFFLQFIIVWRNFEIHNYDVFFFVCDHVAILLAISFFFEKYDWVKALINVGFLGQLFWLFDLLSKLVFDVYLFGVTNYIFGGGSLFWGIVSSLVHLSTLIPALLLTMRYETKKSSFYYSILYLVIVYVLVLLFTNSQSDINCVYNACGISFLQFDYFTFFYLPIAVLLVLFPTYYFQKILYEKLK